MKLFTWLATLLAALTGGAIGLFLILPLGLIAVEVIIFPLALVVAALFAALSAGWTATLLARDATRTQLLSVVTVAEATAVVLALLGFAGAALRLLHFGPWITIAGVSGLILALSASGAAWRFRIPRQQSQNEGRLTLLLLGLAVLLVPLVIWIASLFGLTGA